MRLPSLLPSRLASLPPSLLASLPPSLLASRGAGICGAFGRSRASARPSALPFRLAVRSRWHRGPVNSSSS
jgi:hypothetical protein